MSEASPGDPVIRTPDRRLRIFVSSTLGELAAERRAVSRAISTLRLTPVLFELGARPHPPRDVYRAYLEQSDVFIGLYWQRYGYAAAGMDVSGLEEEFELSADLPRLLYVKVPAPDRDSRLMELISRIEQQASYRTFSTPPELGRLVRDDLATLLSERFSASRPSTETLPTMATGPSPLPVGTTSLIGREQAVQEVSALLATPEVRMVTLTGPGGVGKTRLALAVGERLRQQFDAGTVFVQLATITKTALGLTSIGRSLGAELGTGSPLAALIEQLADGRWLLILDNMEQVLEIAPDLDELLAQCPGVVILATSLSVLRLRAEREYPVPPLSVPPPSAPPDTAAVPFDELAASPAVALFVDRARAVRHDFALTEENAAAVVEICRHLEGLPLAIELAAARTRLLEPDALLERLSRSLDALGTGMVDLPERQRTLRATVEWSVGLLDPAERSLLDMMGVFVDGWSIQAAAHVADIDEDRAVDLTEALSRHSLVRLDYTEFGPRVRMLEIIRQFVAERFAARPDAVEIGGRHAAYCRMLVEHADVQLRGTSQNDCAERMQIDAGNLAASVRWYLDHDITPLPHLFRILALFWLLQDHLGEARHWVDRLMPAADSLDTHARTELMWTAAVIVTEVGDNTEAIAARARLESLLDRIDDPLLSALSQMTLAGISAIIGDIDRALMASLDSIERFRGQDEPFWTAVSFLQAGFMELAVGRYDNALSHLSVARDEAERFNSAWLAAWSRAALGNLAIVRGQLDEAGALLDEALDLSLAAHSTRSVTLCLAAYARLNLVRGDAEEAATLAGAANGLRQRAGLRAWPTLRRGVAELAAQVRQVLGTDRFNEAFATGARLNQREAVAAIQARRAAELRKS